MVIFSSSISNQSLPEYTSQLFTYIGWRGIWSYFKTLSTHHVFGCVYSNHIRKNKNWKFVSIILIKNNVVLAPNNWKSVSRLLLWFLQDCILVKSTVQSPWFRKDATHKRTWVRTGDQCKSPLQEEHTANYFQSRDMPRHKQWYNTRKGSFGSFFLLHSKSLTTLHYFSSTFPLESSSCRSATHWQVISLELLDRRNWLFGSHEEFVNIGQLHKSASLMVSQSMMIWQQNEPQETKKEVLFVGMETSVASLFSVISSELQARVVHNFKLPPSSGFLRVSRVPFCRQIGLKFMTRRKASKHLRDGTDSRASRRLNRRCRYWSPKCSTTIRGV